jgi:LCP family protein required for cell wall assembly
MMKADLGENAMTDVVAGDGPGEQEQPDTEHGGRDVSQESETQGANDEEAGAGRVAEAASGEPADVGEAEGGSESAAGEADEAGGDGGDGGDEDGGDGEGDEARAERRRRRNRRVRGVKIGLLAVTTVASLGVATAFSFAAWDVQHLTRNLKHAALLPSGFTEPPEPVDAYGQSPINILLIGSDTRDTAQDCDLGGDCVAGQANSGANADSEMIVHLSADRSNVTVLSIPRDTETQLPACAGGGRGMINSALAYGPACQVAADVMLTGIPIDHFIDFDFSGVIDLSNEVGGVPVCVSAAVHDPNSGLTIGGGTTNVQGKQALEFLRTRDAFYDGSDLGREQASHIFLSSLLRKVKQNATLTNLVQLQSIAETVTQYTTVDNGLDSALALIDLGEDFGEVAPDRVTFLTMPWQQDTDESDSYYYDRVEPSSAAAGIFAAVKQDESFTTSGGSGQTPAGSLSPSPATSPSPSAPSPGSSGSASVDPQAQASESSAAKASEQAAALAHPMHVNVVNASGTTERFETVVPQVFQDGFVYTSGSDATSTTPTTTLSYPAKDAAAAQELAADLSLPVGALEETTGSASSPMVLTIGTDWTSGATYDAAESTYSPSAAISVPSDSYEENGADASTCVQANPDFETGSAGGSSGSGQ